MAEPGPWERKLEWLGAFLAGQDARRVQIYDRDKFLTAVWEGTKAGRKEQSFTLEELARPWVPYKNRPGAASRSTLLGRLGHEIDSALIDVASIHEEKDGFVVTGSTAGHYENRSFSYAELEGRVAPAARQTLDDDATQPLVAPTRDNSPLRHRLHLAP